MNKFILTSSLLSCLSLMADTHSDDFDSLFSGTQRNQVATTTNMSASQDNSMSMKMSSDMNYPGRGKMMDVFHATPNPLDGIGLSTFGEFLYWDSGCNTLTRTTGYNVPYANGIIPTPNDPNNITRSMDGFNTHFSPGLRLGLTHNLTTQGWDLLGSWTYYTNHKTNIYQLPPTKVLTATLMSSNLPRVYLGISANPVTDTDTWDLSYNQGDLVFGKEIYFSKYYSLRPNMGARYIQASDRLKLLTFEYDNNSITPTDGSLVKIHNNLKAFGFSAGIDNKFCLGYGLSLVNNLNVGLAYGRNTVDYNTEFGWENGASGFINFETWNLSTKDLFPVVDAKLDLAWERPFYHDKLAIALSVGYEYHVVIGGFTAISTSTLFQANTNTFAKACEQPNVQHTNLYMQGVNIGAALKF